MKRILTIMMSLVCLWGCEKSSTVNTFESNVQKLYGNYMLSDIHWNGRPVNLNYDDTGYWDLLNEFQNKIGYFEPDYVADVSDGIIFSKEESWAEPAVAFNVTIPYPNFILYEDKWLCTDIRSFKLTVRGTEETFKLMENSCWIYPGHVEQEDLFLAGIKSISVYVESFDDDCFKIGSHCTLPNDKADGSQKLNDNYLYYTFAR